MLSKLPKYIQPITLGERTETLSGQLPASMFPRLSPLLLSTDNPITLNLEFGRDLERFHYITGKITADLPLECQRCLKPMNYLLQIQVSLSPVFTETAIKKLPSRYEPLLLDEKDQVELVAMVEDEILLALPFVPKHEFECC